ncbi:MAG: acyl-CoA thioesterase [Promethearchaeota archaeon]|nr:MAG: acyl-CoA thioesterase [Candidatus Lokiarchaeota archaeon]
MIKMEETLLKELLNVEDSIEIKVRVNDINAFGIVHFQNYLAYFEEGFVSFMNNIQDPLAIENALKSGIVFPVKKINIEYVNSAEFGDQIIIKTRIKELEENSIKFLHNIYRESDNSLLAKVECERAVMELKSKKILNVKNFFSKLV